MTRLGDGSGSTIRTAVPCEALNRARGKGPRGEACTCTIIFNPDRADLTIGSEDLWGRHRPGAPVTVLRREWSYARSARSAPGRFTVPPARPGRHLVALYDGGEGGQHYSWDSFRVVRRAPGAAALFFARLW